MATRIGLGLAALGRPGYINLGHAADLERRYDVETMRRRAEAVLDAAYEAGVRYFDVARSYGRGEEFLGGWLARSGTARDDAVVASKWGYAYTADWRVDAAVHEVKEHSLARLRQQLAESRSLLGERLDVYQIHSATLESGVLELREVLDELCRLRDSGVAVGLTVTGPRQAETIRRAVAIAIGGRRLFSTVQATWNLLETSAGEALAEAHAAGLGVIVKEGLANGRLSARNDDSAFADKRRALEAEASRLGASLDAFALAAVLAQPWAVVVLSGAATVEQLRSNVRALEVPVSAVDLERLAALAEPPEAYWSTRQRLAWN